MNPLPPLAVALLVVGLVPFSVAEPLPDLEAPPLVIEAIGTDELTKVEWNYTDDYKQRAEFQIYRYDHADDEPRWEMIFSHHDDRSKYVDTEMPASNTTWYSVTFMFADGSFVQSEPESNSEYPHCEVIFVGLPLYMQPGCLTPPPWPYGLVVDTVDKVLEKEGG